MVPRAVLVVWVTIDNIGVLWLVILCSDLVSQQVCDMVRIMQAVWQTQSTGQSGRCRVLQNMENWSIIQAYQIAVKPSKAATLPVGKMKAQEKQAFGEYVKAWRGRLAKQTSEQRMQAQHLREVAQCCAERLVQDFGASRVYLFGSLLEDDVVHDRSDIDLAVEGLDGRLYFKALRVVWSLLPAGVELDLVLLESSWPGLAERVKTEGVLLDAAA